ncbi:MAG: NAAT family transporter [Spirochaetes bacterium]|jgi:multiple antibiotic resistance protein|nr:NAAT family transporter [Spirochaetota bacterium]
MSVFAAAVTLFLVMDPIGNIPMFLSLLRQVEEARRKRVILREVLIAFAVLALFLFFGKYVLSALHITEPALGIAGGVVLFLIAVRMVFPWGRDQNVEAPVGEPLVVPLAIPLIAGPSAMATVILLSNQAPGRIWMWFLALAIATAAALVVLFSAEILRRRLGSRFLVAIERLMGMILATLSVQMLLNGIREYVQSFG